MAAPTALYVRSGLTRKRVVQEQKGTRGGLFVDRAAATRFIRAEAGYKPQAIVIVSGILELDTGRKINAIAQGDIASNSETLRRIA